MTIRRVALGGDNTDGSTWAKAYTTFANAVSASTASGDVIWVDKDYIEELSTDTTYTFTNNVSVICVDKDASDALATMGTAAWIGNSTTNRSVILAGAYTVYFYGITFRLAGTLGDSIIVGQTDGADYVLDACYLWVGTTSTSGRLIFGTSGAQTYAKLKNSTIRFANSSQRIETYSSILFENTTISSDGTAPSVLCLPAAGSRGSNVQFYGCDLSFVTGTLVGDSINDCFMPIFINCKLGSGVSPLASQTIANNSSAHVCLFNCSSGDEHYQFAHYNSLGNTTVSTGIYANDNPTYDGTNKCSWKIVTSANASFYTPYISPWIDKYHSDTSAITPYLECMRDNSSGVVYQDDEVWGEFSYQGTSGFPLSTIASDRMAILGTAADQAASSKTTSDWTGETGTPGFFKIDSGSAITPAEIGHLRARVCVGEPSITVYVAPWIYGLD